MWVDAKLDEEGRVRFKAYSDSEVSRGFCGCLIWILDGCFPEQVLDLKTDDLGLVNFGGITGVNSRVNTWYNVLVSMQKKTRSLIAEKEGRFFGEPFPSLVVSANGVSAKGSFAEAQVFCFCFCCGFMFVLLLYLFVFGILFGLIFGILFGLIVESLLYLKSFYFGYVWFMCFFWLVKLQICWVLFLSSSFKISLSKNRVEYEI